MIVVRSSSSEIINNLLLLRPRQRIDLTVVNFIELNLHLVHAHNLALSSLFAFELRETEKSP